MRIRTFCHKGLRRFYESGDRVALPQQLIVRIIDTLAVIEAVPHVTRIGTLPKLRLHRVKGNLSGFCSVSVSDNWRIILPMAEEECFDIGLAC